MFDFENAHIVRNNSTKKCKTSIHGHEYNDKIEVFIEKKAIF